MHEIDIGSSSVENETNKIDRYILSKLPSIRGRLVKRNIVIELNPASHNLSELRQESLTVVTVADKDVEDAMKQQSIFLGSDFGSVSRRHS